MKNTILILIFYLFTAISANAEVIPTNQWVSFWSDSTYLYGSPAEPGDTVNVFDPQGVLCGTGIITSSGVYPLLSVYRDNPYTPSVDEGAEPGDSLYFTINGIQVEPVGPGAPIWTFHGHVQKLNLATIKFTLTMTVNQIGWGTTKPEPGDTAVFKGAVITIEAIPASGYRFGSWTGDTVADPDSSTTTITMDADKTVTANFKKFDTDPPYLAHCYPPSGALAVPKNTNIQFRIKDDGDGIDLLTLDVKINDTKIITKGTDQTHGRVKITHYSQGSLINYDPLSNFPEQSVVSIQVQCQDLAPSSNRLDSTYFIKTGISTVKITNKDIINQNGCIITDESTDIEIEILPGSVDEEIEIYTGTVENPPSLPDTVSSLGSFYCFGPDGLRFADYVMIGIPYKQEYLDTAGVTDPMDLPIYYYSTIDGEWTRLKAIDKEYDFVFVNVKEFCYMVFGKLIQTSIEEQKIYTVIPDASCLEQNYPNPFNPVTVIQYKISRPAHVILKIYDIKGQYIKTVVDRQQTQGVYDVTWNGTNNADQYIPSGLYILKMTAGNFVKIIKMSFCK